MPANTRWKRTSKGCSRSRHIQRDLLALAANELIHDLPRPRAPYSDDFREEPGHAEPVIAEPAQDSGAATGQGPVKEKSGDDSGLAGGTDGLAETPEG